MANQYTLTNDFAEIAEEKGTLYNKGDSAIELASTADTEKGAGILLLTGERRTFSGTLYARSMDAAGLLNVADFNDGGEGGDNVLTYKGSVETYDDLPSTHNVGDVYNIETADETHGILAGDNVAWNGTSWDRLAGIYAIMTGATSSAAGKAGLAPAPAAGDQDKSLRGDGTWAIPRAGYFRRARKAFTLADMINAVASGNYNEYDIEPGDYYEASASGYTYIFAGHNPMRGTYTGYPVEVDHAGLIVNTHTTSKWNETNDTTGGYVSSVLHSYLVNTVLPKVKTDLGTAHLIAHKKLYSTSVGTSKYNRYGTASGASDNWAWSDAQYIAALSEVQVYGSTVWSSSGYDTGEADQQLEVFRRFKHTEIFGNEYPWLRDVVSSSAAAFADYNGYAGGNSASHASYAAGLICFH